MRIDGPFLSRFLANCERFGRPGHDPDWNEVHRWLEGLGAALGGPQMPDRLAKFQSSCSTLDWLLTLTRKRYRDHAQHQWQVWRLGWFLLHVHVAPETPYWRYAGVALGVEEPELVAVGPHHCCAPQWVQLTWWLAAMFHDHAYPVSLLLEALESAVALAEDAGGAMGGAAGAAASASEVRKACRTLAGSTGVFAEDTLRVLTDRHLRDASRTFLEKRLVSSGIVRAEAVADLTGGKQKHDALYDHGLWSAANMASQFESWGQPVSANEADAGDLAARCRREACRAIAVHACLADTHDVDVAQNPFGWLLCLADELQEWDRRVVDEDIAQAVAETDCVELENLHEPVRLGDGPVSIPCVVASGGCYHFEPGQPLRLVFPYSDIGRLYERTGWRAEKFLASKRRRLGHLRVPANKGSGVFWPQALDVCLRDQFCLEMTRER